MATQVDLKRMLPKVLSRFLNLPAHIGRGLFGSLPKVANSQRQNQQ